MGRQLKLMKSREREGGRKGEGEGQKGEDKGEGERKIVICFVEYRNPYGNAIASPTYIAIHLIYPAKQVQLASLIHKIKCLFICLSFCLCASCPSVGDSED